MIAKFMKEEKKQKTKPKHNWSKSQHPHKFQRSVSSLATPRCCYKPWRLSEWGFRQGEVWYAKTHPAAVWPRMSTSTVGLLVAGANTFHLALICFAWATSRVKRSQEVPPTRLITHSPIHAAVLTLLPRTEIRRTGIVCKCLQVLQFYFFFCILLYCFVFFPGAEQTCCSVVYVKALCETRGPWIWKSLFSQMLKLRYRRPEPGHLGFIKNYYRNIS